MADRSEIAAFEYPVPAHLPLQVDQILNGVGGMVIEGVHIGERRRYISGGAGASRDRIVVEQARHTDVRGQGNASGDVARHIEDRVADILVVENTEAGADYS